MFGQLVGAGATVRVNDLVMAGLNLLDIQVKSWCAAGAAMQTDFSLF